MRTATLMGKTKSSLEMLGWNSALEKHFAESREKGLEPGRIAVEDKHHYVIFSTNDPLIGKVSGKLLHETTSRSELPKVGDWIAFEGLPNEEKAVIHRVLPRRTKLSRKVPGRETEEQVLVTNIDIAFVVQALDRSFNPALIQRHLTMVIE